MHPSKAFTEFFLVPIFLGVTFRGNRRFKAQQDYDKESKDGAQNVSPNMILVRILQSHPCNQRSVERASSSANMLPST